IPGIGARTAQRLLLELKGKLAETTGATLTAPVNAARQDILNALLALGYNEREAASALKQLPPDAGISEGIRQALKLLSKV
ncbi:MAG: Holliday junction branch migration protein RuvA, partial [Candidatus Dechloromonas phosphoritropha]